MSLLTLMREIGPDAELLTRSDQWLEEERLQKSQEMERLSKELYAILLAQRIKNKLQQSNLVPVQQILRDSKGNIREIIIRILNLPDALVMLLPTDTLDEVNAAAQILVWGKDGYDLKTSSQLR